MKPSNPTQQPKGIRFGPWPFPVYKPFSDKGQAGNEKQQQEPTKKPRNQKEEKR